MTSFAFICDTCRTYRYLGYGAFGTWGNVASANSAQHFWDSLSVQDRKLTKNLETLSAFADHAGHTFSAVCDDAMDNFKEDYPDYRKEPCRIWDEERN